MNLRNVIAVAAVLILAASCTSGTEGIFASIEREQKIVSLGGLSKYATVTSMAESGGTYYATGGKALFSRAVTGTTWDKSSVAGNTEVQAVGATKSPDTVYVIAGGTLYRLGGTTWTAVAVSGGETPYDLVPIRGDDGYSTTELLLVTSVGSPAKKNVVYRIVGTTLTPLDLSVSAGIDLGAPAMSAAKDITGSSYYLASESFLWKVDLGFTTATRIIGANLQGIPVSGYGGLIFQGTKLYVGTISNNSTGGGIYSADPSGAIWTFTALVTDVKAGTYPVSFGQFLNNTTNGSVWVATRATVGQEGNGYMEIASIATVPSFSQTPTTDGNNYTSSAIKTYNVATLFKGSTGYFLGTVAHGLWTWDSAKKTWGQQ